MKKPRTNPLRTEWQRKWLDLEVTHPDVLKLADIAQAFAFSWFNRSPGKRLQVVVGKVGTGKSHVAERLDRWTHSVAYEAWCRSYRGHGNGLPMVVRVDWAQVASPETCIRQEFDAWMQDIDEASMVILDDVGTETDAYKSCVPVERLCHVLNRCDGKFTWINTNILPSEWSARWDARVEDRLLAGHCIEVNAPSYRSEIQKASSV